MTARPTLDDVARLAGCSVSTVSRVVNDHPNVHDATRDAVNRAIDQLGYRPSALARALHSRRTNLVGALISSVTNPFFAELVHGVEVEARDQGFIPILCSVAEDLSSTNEYVQALLDYGVAGLLVASARPDDAYLPGLRRDGLPVVLVNRPHPSFADAFVGSDDVASGALATQHLIDCGHTRIAHIGGPHELVVCDLRTLGYQEALSRNGLDWSRVSRATEISAAAASAAVDQLFAEGPAPTAIFVVNDYLAIDVLHHLAVRGYRVPEDVAVVGCDDIEVARVASVSLTTVSSHAELMGRHGMRMLADLILDGGGEPKREILAPELRIRGTCGWGASRPPA